VVNQPKPVGVIVVAVVLLGSGAILGLIAIALALGNVLFFDDGQSTWLLIVSGVAGLVVAFRALRVGSALLADPAKGRESAETALWFGIGVVWLAMLGLNLLLTEGADDVAVWPLLVMLGLPWTAVAIWAALYMRSTGVRAYFDGLAT
jgi:hypothetical protein